jgi:hypothetical protein
MDLRNVQQSKRRRLVKVWLILVVRRGHFVVEGYRRRPAKAVWVSSDEIIETRTIP